jgi:hypothetical protein
MGCPLRTHPSVVRGSLTSCVALANGCGGHGYPHLDTEYHMCAVYPSSDPISGIVMPLGQHCPAARYPRLPDLKWTMTGQFSTSLAYATMFLGQIDIPGASTLWKSRAPGKCRFFLWLILLGRCWTSERLHHHGLDNDGPCAL